MRIKPKGPKGLRHRLILQTFGLVGFVCSSCVTHMCAAWAADKPELTRLFPFGGQAGTVVEVEAAGKFPVWPLQVWSDTDSIRWSTEEANGKLKVTIDASTRPGLHWMRLYHAKGATVARPFLVTETVEQIETEPNNRLATANSITSLPSGVQGVVHKRGEVDIFSIKLDAGQRLIATVDAEQVLHSPWDATLQLLDMDGFLIDESLDHFGLDPSIEWIAPKEAKYFLRVFGFPSTPDQTIAFGGGDAWIYRLRLESNAGDHHYQRSVSPDLPESIVRAIEPGQATSRDEANLIEMPCSIGGKIDAPGVSKYLRFKGVAGQHYRLQLQARGNGSDLDATVAILDPTGKQIVLQDDVGEQRDPDLKWKAPSDGEYIVEIKDFHKRGGDNYRFELSMSQIAPDFKLSIPSDVIQVSIGKETEVEVAITRECDFAGEIVVSLEGAPEGVDCAPIASIQGKETNKKVTLKIKSTVQFQGPISVSAKAKDLGDRIRLATTEHGKPIWLSCITE